MNLQCGSPKAALKRMRWQSGGTFQAILRAVRPVLRRDLFPQESVVTFRVTNRATTSCGTL